MQVHHPISLKGNKESKGDFTRMKMKNKIHFPCVKMRKRGTKKGGKHKENGVISISEAAKREANNRNNESEQRNPSPFLFEELQWQTLSRLKSSQQDL